MAAPISNNRPLPSSGQQTSRADEKGGNRAQGNSEAASPAPQANSTAEDRVEINQANRLLSQNGSPVTRSESAIDSPEQAQDLVTRIREQIESEGAQALTAQGGAISGHIDSLLNSAPSPA